MLNIKTRCQRNMAILFVLLLLSSLLFISNYIIKEIEYKIDEHIQKDCQKTHISSNNELLKNKYLI